MEYSISRNPTRDMTRDTMIVFVFLVTIGFPGNLELIIGSSVGMLLEYGAFVAEMAVMVIYSGDNLLDFKIIQVKRQNVVIYLTILLIFTETIAVANEKAASFITVFRFAILALFGLWMSDHFDLEAVLKYILTAQLLYVFFTFVFLALKPGSAFYSTGSASNALRGLEATKNTCGSHFSCFIILESLYLKIKADKKAYIHPYYILFLVLQFMLLLLCKATGSIICAAIALFFIFRLSGHRIPIGWIYCLVNVGWILFALYMLPLIAPLLEAVGKDATLTGRTDIWNAAVTLMMSRNTFTGFGFGRFWVEPQSYTLIQSMFNENAFWANVTAGAHNMLLELWLNIGILGIALMFLMIIVSTRKIRELKAGPYLFITCMLFYLLISGLTERIFSNSDYKTLLFFYAMALGCDRPVKQDHLFSWQRERLAALEAQRQQESA